MDENSEEMFLQNLEEFVLDEDKIVTYKWLSKTLNIHVNQSKQLLYAFCSNKTKQESVTATYLLAGRLRSTGENHITVVGQEKYQDVKSSFDSLTSEHVYSVQKVKKTPSHSILYTADSQTVEEKEAGIMRLGAIKCKESVRRAAEELALLRITVPLPSSSTVPKTKQPASAPAKESEKASPIKSPLKSDKNGKDAAGKDSKVKSGLAAMFAAQTSKASAKTATAPVAKNNASNKKGVGISNFFSKVNKEEQVENLKAKESNTNTESTESKEELMNENDDVPPAKPLSPVKLEKRTDSEPKKKALPKATKDSKQKRSRTKDKKEKEDPKKRKRIVVQESDSSDDDVFAEEEEKVSSRESSPIPVLEAQALESDDEVILPTPPVKSCNSNGRCRRKRKVTKDKTFMDDDGYIVTEKVTEYESYSESDTEGTEAKKMKEPPASSSNGNNRESASSAKSKNEKAKAPTKKASPVKKSPVKNKQQSLMNFFKKK